MKYKFKEFDRMNDCYRYIITEDGHTKHVEDIVQLLNNREILRKKNIELEKQNEELFETIKGMCLADTDDFGMTEKRRLEKAEIVGYNKAIRDVVKILQASQ